MPKKKTRAAPFECRDKSDPDLPFAASAAHSLLTTADCFRKVGDAFSRLAFIFQELNMTCEKQRKRKAESRARRCCTGCKWFENHKKRKRREKDETEETDSYTTVEEEEYAEACQGTRTPARGFIADKMGKIINVKFPPGKKEEMMNAVTAELPEHVMTGNLEEVDKRLRVLAWLATCE